MNIYRGCTHGCVYCDSRSACYQFTHDFEDIEVKQNAPELLRAAQRLCEDIARLDETHFDASGGTAKAAVLFTLAYLYEHREEADHHALVLTLRNLLMGIREEGF